MKKMIIVFGITAILAIAVPILAGQIPEPWINVRITTNEQIIIRDYYHTHQMPVAGTAKQKKLPPGLQKKVEIIQQSNKLVMSSCEACL